MTFISISNRIILAVKLNRGVAQLGRALRSGRRGRVFESRRLDYLVKEPEMPYSAFPVLFVLTMADLLYALDGFPYMVIRSSLISKY